ncbi:hypothetical protein YC2023_053203 [Brassica napus]
MATEGTHILSLLLPISIFGISILGASCLHRTSWSSSVIADEFERKPSRFVFFIAMKSSFLLHVVLSATHLRCTLTAARGGRDARTRLRWSSLQLHDEPRATMAKSHKNFKI